MTNNPEVAGLEGAEYADISLLEILEQVRDLVHHHYVLITHPMAGSVKPNETPYKSVALSAKPAAALDMQSLQIIEAALQLSQQLLRDRPLPVWNAKVLSDFALIDRSLLDSGLDGLRHY